MRSWWMPLTPWSPTSFVLCQRSFSFSMFPCRLVGTGLPYFQSMFAGHFNVSLDIPLASWRKLHTNRMTRGRLSNVILLVRCPGMCMLWQLLWPKSMLLFFWHHCRSRLLHILQITLRSYLAKVYDHGWQPSFSVSMASICLSRIRGVAWLYYTISHFMTLW